MKGVSGHKLQYSLIADGDDINGNVIPSGVAVVIEAKEKKSTDYTFVEFVKGTQPTYTDTNLLRGNDTVTNTSSPTASLFYKLTYGQPCTYQQEIFGWYWGSADGAVFSIEGHRAWLAVPRSVAKSTLFFTLPNDMNDMNDMEQGIDIEVQNTIYDLQGRRIANPVRSGLYIINRKLQLVQ